MKCIIFAVILCCAVAVQSSVIPISPLAVGGPILWTSSPGLVVAHPHTIAIAAAPVHPHTIAIAAAPVPEKSIAIHASTAPVASIIAAPQILEIAGSQPHTIEIAAAPAPAVIAAVEPVPEKTIAIHASTAPGATIIAAPHIEIAGPQPHTIEVAAAVPAPVVVAAPAIVAAEGQYHAETRGSVHSAPLPGHINSASSINLEAAPGTI